MAHQLDVLELRKRLNEEQGKTIVLMLHDLNLASRYANYLVLMRGGAIVAKGDPGKVLTCERIAEVFDVEVELRRDEHTGRPVCTPLRVRRT